MGSLGNSGNGRDRDSGVETWPAYAYGLDRNRQAETQLGILRIPVLLHADNPHERLYIAALDGTGNSMINDNPEHWSVVAKTYQQIRNLKKQGITNIAGGYVEGTFTQEGWLRVPSRLLDGRFGHSFDERVETAYFDFCVQARTWLIEDPQAQIRVAGLGFSRGAEEAAVLLRMIDERGVRDPEGTRVSRDRDGVLQRVDYADRPPLVAPGKTLQAALLFDPVPTGVRDEDRRLRGATMSTFEIVAEHERRDMFPASDHVPPGFSENQRNLSVTLAGSHSDIGDTYGRNGLGTLSFNLGVEFLNRLSDRPYLDKRALPDDPAQYVVHRSEQHMHGLYSTRGYDRDGVRDRSDDLSPQPGLQHKDPIRPALEQHMERRTAPASSLRHGTTPIHDADQQASLQSADLFERAFAAYMGNDDRAFTHVMDQYRHSPDGLAWARMQQQYSLGLREQERHADLQQQAAWAEQQRAQPQHLRGPEM